MHRKAASAAPAGPLAPLRLQPDAATLGTLAHPLRPARGGVHRATPTAMTRTADIQNLAHRTAEDIRQKLLAGACAPGQRLSEAAMAELLGISRNTLREAFRILTQEGLLCHEPNRGVSVTVPTLAAIIDIYRVRRMLECQALAQAHPWHPARQQMEAAIADALRCRDAGDWRGVGTANMAFHRAIVSLTDSERLQTLFSHVLTELRLVFGMLQNPEFLHAPYIDMNRHILSLFIAGQHDEAAQAMEAYLVHSERGVLAEYARMPQPAAAGTAADAPNTSLSPPTAPRTAAPSARKPLV